MELSVTNEKNVESLFLQPHSSIIRIWHWLTFLLISLSIVTVILNSTVLNPRNNEGAVRDQLKEQNITINERQAFFLAHHFDDQLWDLHKFLGIGISILVLLRIIAELLVPAGEKIKSRLTHAIKLSRDEAGKKEDARHYVIVKATYSIFYLVILIMAVTGISMAFGRELGISGPLHHTIKEFHGALQWVVYLFLIFHTGGVILADLGKAKGIVSGMIHGNR